MGLVHIPLPLVHNIAGIMKLNQLGK